MTDQLTLSGDLCQNPWDDEDLLREMYHEKGMTLREIADELGGCDYTTIHRRMYEFGIEARGSDRGRNRDPYATFHTRADGYEYWSSKTSSVLVHRLLAVSKYGFDTVADGECVIHHDIPIGWLNYADNIVAVASHSDHNKLHREREYEKRLDCPDGVEQQTLDF